MFNQLATIAASSNRVRRLGAWTHMRLKGGTLDALLPVIEALAASGVQVQVCTRAEVCTAHIDTTGSVYWTSRPAKLNRHTATVRVAEAA